MTEITLKEYLEAQIKWLDRHFEAQIRSIDVSTAKTASQIDKRLESMNEFRDSLRDQAARFETKEGSDLKLRPIYDKIEALSRAKAFADGKTMVISGLVAFVASIIVASVAHWVIK